MRQRIKLGLEPFKSVSNHFSVVYLVIATVDSPLVKENVSQLGIADTFLIDCVKYVNLAVLASKEINNTVFKVKDTVRTNRVDDTVCSLY